MRVKLLCVAGGRPNFPKVAALWHALRARGAGFETRLVNTGQHYHPALSNLMLDELGLPAPDVDLGVGSASHAVQSAEVMRRFEPVLCAEQPHAVVVTGDINSTLAAALTVAKFSRAEGFLFGGQTRRRPVLVHVEAGLRSFDDDMPEEINRRLTDSIADLLFVSEPSGMENLEREGIRSERCHLVGNVMIDTLLAAKERAFRSNVLSRLELELGRYAVLTLHRPSNVDDPRQFRSLLATLDEIAADLPIVFPVHPRTREHLDDEQRRVRRGRWVFVEPLGYLDFLKLQACAGLVLTDSGGIQEETTVLGVPCITLREHTERPVTVGEGTNVLGRTTRDGILAAYATVRARPRAGTAPRYWDGHAAERIVGILEQAFSSAEPAVA